MLSLQLFSSLVDAEAYTSDYSNVDNLSNPYSRGAHGTHVPPEVLTSSPSVAGQQKRSDKNDYMKTTLRLLADNIRLRNDIAKLYKGIKDVNNELLQEDQSAFNDVDSRSKRNTQEYNTNNDTIIFEYFAEINSQSGFLLPLHLNSQPLFSPLVNKTSSRTANLSRCRRLFPLLFCTE